MKQKNVLVISAILLVLAFVAGAFVYRSQKADAAGQAYQRDKSSYVRPHSPGYGHPAAKVDIVEFFDPACETCKQFFPMVKELMAKYPNKIRLYARYTPFHQGSDTVLKMLAAADKQGKFWETLEAVFASQSYWVSQHQARPELVWNHIGNVGLDLARLRADMELPEIANMVRQDLADAKTLNVKATPEFFVNGKPLPTWGYEQLKTLVEDEVRAAY